MATLVSTLPSSSTFEYVNSSSSPPPSSQHPTMSESNLDTMPKLEGASGVPYAGEDESVSKKQRLENGQAHPISSSPITSSSSSSSVQASLVPFDASSNQMDISSPPAASSSASSSSRTGPGMALGDLAVLTKRLEKVSNEDPRTKFLFAICFPYHTGPLPDRSAKKQLRTFSGYTDEATKAKANERILDFAGDIELLRKTARLLDLPSEGPSEQLVRIFIDYMSSPAVPEKPVKEEVPVGEGGRKRTTRPKSDKRPPNPYQLFASDHREEVVAASPGLQMMEVNRLLGQLWSRADEETKAKYKQQADEARVVWERDHPEAALARASASGAKRKRGSGAVGTSGSSGGIVMADVVNYDENGGMGGNSDQESVMSDAHPRRPTPSVPLSGSSHNAASSPAPAVDRELAARLQSSIARILASADLEVVSYRMVKASLAQEFSEKVVLKNALLIKTLVNQELLKLPD